MTNNIDARMSALEHEVHQLHTDMREMRETLSEIKVYFKIGRWVMYVIWTVIGGTAATMLAKWIEHTKL